MRDNEMTSQTITLQLPEEIYRRLKRVSQVTQRSLEEVAFQSLQGNLPPSVDDLPPELQAECAAMQALSDESLWQIARQSLPNNQWQRHQALLRKNERGRLSAAYSAELESLRSSADQSVYRRSYALALLKWRGHNLPTP
jgi:hypothetical protein